MPPFEYKPFINPYIGSISELMGKGDEAKAQALLRIGEIQARAAEQQGQAWGNAIQGLGNIAGKAFTDYAQEKKDAPIRAAEAAHREALGAADIFAAEQAVRTQALQGRQDTARELYNQRLSGTMPSPIGPVPMMRREQAPAGVAEDGTPRLPSSNLVQEPHPFQLKQNGAWVYDIEKYKQAAAAAGVAVESDPFFQAMSETNQLRQDTQAKAGVQAKQQAGLLLGMPDAQLMQNAPAAVNALRGLYNDDVLDSFMALHKSGDVPQIRAALGRLAGAKYETPVVPGQTLQSQFGDSQTTPGTPPVKMEGNPISVLEDGQPMTVIKVATPDGGNAWQRMDGSPVTGKLTMPATATAGTDASRIALEVRLFTAKNGRPPSDAEQLSIERRVALEKPASADTGAKIGPTLQLANSLKSNPAYVKMLDIESGYAAVQAGMRQKNGAGDIAVINALQRMIDPGVSVREGDVALLQSAQPFLEGLKALGSSFSTGSKFSPAMRESVLKLASDLMAARASGFNESVGKQYRSIADQYGIPYQMVGQDFTVPADPNKKPVARPSAGRD